MRLTDEYIDEARTRANKHQGAWTGTSGSLAADVRRLLLERESLLHQLDRARRRKPPRVIGFAGWAGSGKNLAAEATGGYVIGFADPLYAALAAMLGMSVADLQDRSAKEKPLPCGKSPRDLLRTLGTDWGRDMVRPDLWVFLARERIEAAAAAGLDPIAICDCRFPNELELVRELGGLVLWVSRPGVEAGNHVSDQAIGPQDCDGVVVNSGTVEQLREAVLACLR